MINIFSSFQTTLILYDSRHAMILKVTASLVILRIIIAHGSEATDDKFIRNVLKSEGNLEKDLINLAEVTEAGPASGGDYEEDVGNNIEMTDDEFYDYYGLDYGEEDEDAGIGDLLSDLDPELLQNISPTLIVGFFESASPEDVKAILDNSEVLLKLPPETIGLIVQKLPNELIIQIVNSEGVRNLFLNISSTTAPDELKKN